MKIYIQDFNGQVSTGSTIYVDIDVFRFVKDFDLKNVIVEMNEQGEYQYLHEVETITRIKDHEDLKNVAFEWIMGHVSNIPLCINHKEGQA